RENGRIRAYPISFTCRQGRIALHFQCEQVAMDAAMDAEASSGGPFAALRSRGPEFLLQKINVSVRIVVTPASKTERPISATFLAKECAELLKNEWPSSENFTYIERAIREKNHYPMPQPEIPGGGGKSDSAQGQTKKPGSHSHDKHR